MLIESTDAGGRAIPSPYSGRKNWNSPATGGLMRQLERRSEILARTRAMISSDGYSRFSVRHLAESCRTSPQTIHSYFGDKRGLVASSIIDYNRAMIDASAQADIQARSVPLFYSYVRCIEEYPDFMVQITRAMYAHPEIYDRAVKDGGALILNQIAEPRLPRVIMELCRQMVSANSSIVFEWVHGLCSTRDTKSRVYQSAEIYTAALEVLLDSH